MIGKLISIFDDDIPYHPLEGMGYESIGDHHSTESLIHQLIKLDMAAMDVSVVCILIFPRDLTFRFDSTL